MKQIELGNNICREYNQKKDITIKQKQIEM